MGIPQPPQEAAPAYDDVFNDHPVNRFAPSGSASAVSRYEQVYFTWNMDVDMRQYSTVPQSDDVELHAHIHTPPSSEPSQGPETFAQTIASVLRPKPQPHVHCETCDVQTAATQRRANEKHCCTMVAATFMTLFVCGMLLGMVIVSYAAKRKRHEG
jgi:hypothetical protein